ncbi:MAG: hypothetical protein B0D96_01095 [Candidatus Sedimenticola endophacoides]|uniref:Antitermination protein NusG n=1 Tax=Candidatus Sedimenticola endophacoides TaxID=2548426 RepID=A0A657PVB7_9GAMM|nr:MAG: hypothetical protein B0D94_11475 [Candidatus Sedimenticola endophacoides]OQX37937.1 MAG: hypothetical protein B0D96_01095 [Candidatus Sedimenticola endophacoides]OQX38896.1 MAG: hypothetical protein B0D89_11815 [Candidatus Sedimenticola endophacoides]OQX45470.1 MAG: hypothetical protein B0D88_00295 [Candidatus Sedimenticola endophacoides]OQX49021.1 MAG: hypothetical protein B0D87_02625 [Candidatus Sedimenticola endophacoides]
MIWKLLLTALVIAGALYTVRGRQQRMEQVARASALAAPPPRSAPRLVKVGAALLVVIMVAGAGFYLFHQWRDAYQIVSVRVIDTRSGQTVTYQAYKGDIEGRRFITTRGVVVSLAEVERMELGGE